MEWCKPSLPWHCSHCKCAACAFCDTVLPSAAPNFTSPWSRVNIPSVCNLTVSHTRIELETGNPDRPRMRFDRAQYHAPSMRSQHHNATRFENNESGVAVCYSGLLRGFGVRGFRNHLDFVLAPLAAARHAVDVYFSTAMGEHVPRTIVQLLEARRIGTIKEEHRGDDELGRIVHLQYLGIEHCGRLIAHGESRRQLPYSFALRMRYDFIFDVALRSLPRWPIFRQRGPEGSVAATLSKQRSVSGWSIPVSVRCLPVDVWAVVRRDIALGPSVASFFLNPHLNGHNFVTRDSRDRWEATLLAPVIERGLRVDVAWSSSSEYPCMYARIPKEDNATAIDGDDSTATIPEVVEACAPSEAMAQRRYEVEYQVEHVFY